MSPIDGKPVIVFGDDDHDLTHLFARWLREAGFEVIPVHNWSELRDAMKHLPDLFVLDNLGRKGEGQGLEEARKLHRAGYKVIVTSALYQEDADGLPMLPKPFDGDELLAKVRQVLGLP